MIRNLLATTAIATLVATGAIAQSTAPTDPMAPTTDTQTEMTIRAEGHLASELIGQSVYNSTGEDAENIGEITDLVIANEGDVQAIVVGVGGFLGIGQKEVALEYDLAEWSEQQDGERWLVVETTRDALEAQEEFDRSAYRPMPADAQVSETQPATQEDLANAPTQQQEGGGGETALAPADDQSGDQSGTAGGMAAVPTDDPADDTTAAAPADDQSDTTAAAPMDQGAAGGDDDAQDTAATDQQATDQQATDQQTAQSDQAEGGQAGDTDSTLTGAVDPGAMQEAQPDQIRADNLTGTAVYGANEEHIGEIGDVILTPEGDVDAVIVDVGGFLGIGEKEVAIGMDNLSFMTDEDGELYLFTEFTQEALEAQPAYDDSTYAQQRDEMRMQVQ